MDAGYGGRKMIWELIAIFSRYFATFTLSIMEVMLLKKKGEVLDSLIEEVRGRRIFKEALSEGRGVILLTI